MRVSLHPDYRVDLPPSHPYPMANSAAASRAAGGGPGRGGGTHPAFANRRESFCALNGVANAIRSLQAEVRLRRALVVDLDGHQGNGTATIFACDGDVYTLSRHGERNRPARKAVSSRDVGLPDGSGGDAYLQALAAADPEIVFLVAGVDVVACDRDGRFALSDQGLGRREQHVRAAVRDHGHPLANVPGGGYARTAQRSAELHAVVFEEAALRWRAERNA